MTALVRYIPGNVWQPLSLTLYGQQRQIRPEITLASIVLYQVVTLLAVAPLAACYFEVTGNWGFFTNLIGAAGVWLIWAVLLPVLLFLAKPGWLLAILNWLLGKLGRSAIAAQLTTPALLHLLLLAITDFGLTSSVLGDYDRQTRLRFQGRDAIRDQEPTASREP